MKYLMALLMLSTPAYAEFKVAQLDEIFIDYKHYHPSARHPLFYNSTPKESISLNMNATMLNYFFWNNKVHSMTNSAQYYTVGWNFQIGLRVSKYVDIKYEHHSQHLLDDKWPFAKFPVEDSIGFTIFLYPGVQREGRGILP